MHQTDKRRGGTATQGHSPGHIHRAGSHPAQSTGRHGPNPAKAKEDIKDTTDPPADATNMPTLPPRAAVSSTTAMMSTDEPFDASGSTASGSGTGTAVLGAASSPGAASANDRADKEEDNDGQSHIRDGKEKERGSTGSIGSSSQRRNSLRNASGNTTVWGSNTHATSQKSKRREVAPSTAEVQELERSVAHLKKEMALMEREFQKQLDKFSQNESETATFWQAKYSQLNQQFLRTDTELRLLRNEVEAREEEREGLRQGWEMLRHELKERDDDIRGLRGQVRGLKEFVSTSTRTDGQTSDEVFSDGMTRLGNGLQNWVIVNFRKAKMDLTKVSDPILAELNELVPMYEELALTSKVHLLQSIVSAVLVDMIFDSYYVGLSDEAMDQFRQMEKLLSSFTGADESVNQWRSSTLALIHRESSQHFSQDTASFTERVISRINNLLDAVTSATPSETRDTALRVLVNNSIELARLLSVQKAVLRVYMPKILPHQRVLFELETMEDIGGEDEEGLDQREICCVAFPGIIKNGDENGGHLQYKNVITKARVLCSPEIYV